MNPLPKLCGADIELGNFVLGLDRAGSTCDIASRILLHEIKGASASETLETGSTAYPCYRAEGSWRNGGNGYGQGSQDWGRKYLSGNGGCVYVDLDHLELCIPEVISAFDHVACWNAMLCIAQKALQSVNRKLRGGARIQVLVNNSDGLGHSYGSHVNFLVARNTWENLFNRKLHHMLYLAAYQVSSILFTGQGKAGSENGMPQVDFQISQRADFFEQLIGPQTTHNRPLVNSRDEALCGSVRNRDCGESVAERLARLHVIFFDNTLCQTASLLKVGVTQIILSMIEHERINPNLILDDPLEAILAWSHDPSLRATVRMASGQRLTALELQFLFLEEAKRFLETVDGPRWVPRAEEIMALWEDTLNKLRAGDTHALARRLDWVLKKTILERVLERQPQLKWCSPQIKHLDQLYSSLEPSEGLFWAYTQNSFVEKAVDESRIDWFIHNPPADTRAWTRAMILRRTPPESLDAIDWDSIRIKTNGTGYWSRYVELDMSDPLGFTKEEASRVFREETVLENILESLAANRSDNAENGPQGSERGGDAPVPAQRRITH